MESWMLIILVIMPGVWSGDWGVTFENQCALRGTSVVMKCSYDYPLHHMVTHTVWLKAQTISGQKWLFQVSQLPSKYEYVGDHSGQCNLKIKNVQPSDGGEYYFRFATKLDRWTSTNYSSLSVKELTAFLSPSTVKEGDDVKLTCVSGCAPTTILWFKDGQNVHMPVKARKEDAGRYFCALWGQETVMSNSVTLNVLYAPKTVRLSVSPPGDVVKGRSVTFTCSSDANPPVSHAGYSLYRDGHFIGTGQKHTISDLQPSHSGLYHCQAWNSISWRGHDLINSTHFHLDVQYGPLNMSVSVEPQQDAEGSSVKLTCISDAHPAPDNFTWFKRTDPSSSMLHVGQGQVLSVEASDTGLYHCWARNRVGEGRSTEKLLSMNRADRSSELHLIRAGVGFVILVILVVPLLLYWKKQRNRAAKKQTVSGDGRSSSAAVDPPDSIYANVQTFRSSRPSDTHRIYDVPSCDEAELIYTAVCIKPRKIPRAPQESRATAGENNESVIYSSVVRSY